MNALRKALAAHWRQTGVSLNADEWPGALVTWPGYRVVLDKRASALVLQVRPTRGKAAKWSPAWVPKDPTRWVELHGDKLPGLAALVAVWSDPIEPLAALCAAQGVKVAGLQRCHEWTEPDYPRVIARDANIRVAVDPTGNLFGLQWQPPTVFKSGEPGPWQTLVRSAQRDGLSACLVEKGFEPGASCNERRKKGERIPWLVEKAFDPGASHDERRETGQRIECRTAELLASVPEAAAVGPWPVLPLIASAQTSE